MLAQVSKLLGTAALAATLGACSMGSMFGANEDASYAGLSASQTQVAQAANGALPAIATECPPIRIRDGAGTYRSFAGNRTSDASALRHQAVLDRVSRNCVVSNGLITVNMGAVGRVILGPSGSQGNINVPLRFVVERDSMATFSERYDVAVNAQASSANEFAHTVEGISIPYVGGETITIWVGFDT